MGGAIFFWPRQPREMRTGASVQAGSFGELGGWLAHESGSERAGALVALRRTQADDDYPFLNDGGKRFDLDEVEEPRRNADFETHDAWAIGRLRLGEKGRLSWVVHGFDREQGVTGLSLIPAESARGTARRYLAGLSVRLPCGVGEDCQLEAEASLLAAGLTIIDPAAELLSLRTRLLHSAGTRQTYTARAQIGITEKLDLSGSATQSIETLEIDRIDNLPRDAARSSTRLATTATLRASTDVLLMALASAECHATRGKTDRFGTRLSLDTGTCGTFAPSGRAGIRIGLTPNLDLLANAGRFVRVPTLGELYGSSPLVEGNPSLKVEHGWNYDVGARADFTLPGIGQLSVETFAFARFAEDLIRFRRASLNSAAPFNVATARVLGLESALGSELLGALRVDAATTFMDARETTDDPVLDPTRNDVLPLLSRLVANVRVELFSEPGLAALGQDRAGLALAYLHRASRFDDPGGLSVLPAQNLFDIEASSTHFDGRLLARLAVRNVFDAHQLDLLGLPVPGRSIHGELEAWF
jgi:iron complex outermembrane receptor protein